MSYEKEVEKQKRTEKHLQMFQQVLEGMSYKSVGVLHSMTGPAVSRIVGEVVRIINHPQYRSELIEAFSYTKYPDAYSDQPELFQNKAEFLNTFTLSRLPLVQLRKEAKFLIQFANMIANPMGVVNISRAASAIEHGQILDLLAYEIKMFLADNYRNFKPDHKGRIDVKSVTNHEYVVSRLSKMEFTVFGNSKEVTFMLRQVGSKRFRPTFHYSSHANMVNHPVGVQDLIKLSAFKKWKEVLDHIQGFDYVFA